MDSGLSLCGVLKPEMILRTGFLHAGQFINGLADSGRCSVNFPPHDLAFAVTQFVFVKRHGDSGPTWLLQRTIPYFFKNALNKSIGNGRNVVVLCSLAISRMVWR